uniref:RING-type domain-containing protein n=1 Tax=Chromera velia CCMP2878 TaxID=1169474 RepID=A0A0G4FKG8_9ALVE|eukprot:Cvel_412.t1-p1 / transcript=Cvel_412.t1 / gene=Cvel_412 / organism=Chromera_velia_CCMP2878 / gene_product=E3 ubiquitin-protein ligase RNF181 homolog, putative / transcript_product=E3 ubiquitin-protein ligase RNF181 homolog, putative / location=Cvel_scaffold13:125144-127325(-) / protein_length=408 / sequence_SO=supercontig / SO=protein_coding / is_pseudo=false
MFGVERLFGRREAVSENAAAEERGSASQSVSPSPSPSTLQSISCWHLLPQRVHTTEGASRRTPRIQDSLQNSTNKDRPTISLGLAARSGGVTDSVSSHDHPAQALARPRNGPSSARGLERRDAQSGHSGRAGPLHAERGGRRGWSEMRYSQAVRGADFPDLECNICQEDYAPSSMVLVLPCDHFWHTACLREWLGKSESCPICRMAVPGTRESIRLALDRRREGRHTARATSAATATSNFLSRSASASASSSAAMESGRGGIASSAPAAAAAASASSSSTASRQNPNGLPSSNPPVASRRSMPSSAVAARERARMRQRERDSLASFYQRYHRRNDANSGDLARAHSDNDPPLRLLPPPRPTPTTMLPSLTASPPRPSAPHPRSLPLNSQFPSRPPSDIPISTPTLERG